MAIKKASCWRWFPWQPHIATRGQRSNCTDFRQFLHKMKLFEIILTGKWYLYITFHKIQNFYIVWELKFEDLSWKEVNQGEKVKSHECRWPNFSFSERGERSDYTHFYISFFLKSFWLTSWTYALLFTKCISF